MSKLSGNRRRPFAIREGITGKPKVIGYAPTREEGLQIFAEYKRSPPENPIPHEQENFDNEDDEKNWIVIA